MEEQTFEFECRICDKTFDSPRSLSRHITSKKGRDKHPKFQYYLQKYQIPLKLKKEYDTYIRMKKFEEKSEEVDLSKIGNIKLDNSAHTHLTRVAREGLSNFHVLIAINAEEYNKEFVENIAILYNKTNIHVCVMGRGTKELSVHVPKEISTLMVLETVEYNYSLAINVLLKQVSTNKFEVPSQ